MENLQKLVSHMLGSIGVQGAKITREAMQILRSYQWPGNLRELKNILERAVLLSKRSTLTPEHFSGLTALLPECESDKPKGLHEIQEAHIMTELKRVKGNVSKAAKSLGISRATVYRKLKELQK